MKNTAQKPLASRDLSWLSFNERVLQEASDIRNPLFERIKFLAIYSSNLDEFFKVKVSQLRQMKKVEKTLRKRLFLKPNKKIKEIQHVVDKQLRNFGSIFFDEIIPELATHNIFLLDRNSFNEQQHEYAEKFFSEQLLSSIRIQNEDNNGSIFLEDGNLYLTVFNRNNEITFITIPDNTSRFIALPSDEGTHHFTVIDEVIKANIASLVPGVNEEEVYSIKLSRDAELYLDDDYDGALAQQIYDNLSQRETGQPTRLLYDLHMPKAMRKALREVLKLGKADMIPGGTYHNFSDFFAFEDPTKNPKLHFKPKDTVPHKALEGATDFFTEISKKDQLVHFPYQSFKYVQEFITQAATDPLVKTIKISLYRVAKQSDLTDALLKAIENGKTVVIFIEAQARFDEENNIKWGRTFEAKGATVFYSFSKIKVHSKILLIERQENEKIKRYAYIGTGNFNAKTAKIYCDHGLFTSNPVLVSELTGVFLFLERKTELITTENLLISPFSTRSRFISLIDNEIENANKGIPAKITAKVNALQDTKIISKLYEASQAGVTIILLVRGICCLIPGVEGLSDNIKVISIVDRYLEHARVFLFENGGNEKLYMGSADWMTRNLDRRIEVLTPILDRDVFEELKTILLLQMSDRFKARIIDKEQRNKYLTPVKEEGEIRSQYEIFNYLSIKS